MHGHSTDTASNVCFAHLSCMHVLLQPPSAYLVVNYMKEIAKQFNVDWEPDEQAVVDPLAPIPAPTGVSVVSAGASGPSFAALYASVRLLPLALNQCPFDNGVLYETNIAMLFSKYRLLLLPWPYRRCQMSPPTCQVTRALLKFVLLRLHPDISRLHLLLVLKTTTLPRQHRLRMRLRSTSLPTCNRSNTLPHTSNHRNSSITTSTRVLHISPLMPQLHTASHNLQQLTMPPPAALQPPPVIVVFQILTSSLHDLSVSVNARTKTRLHLLSSLGTATVGIAKRGNDTKSMFLIELFSSFSHFGIRSDCGSDFFLDQHSQCADSGPVRSRVSNRLIEPVSTFFTSVSAVHSPFPFRIPVHARLKRSGR